MSSKHKKKSISKIIKWLVVIALALLIIIALGIDAVHHSYPLAKTLPVSQKTKIKAFWNSLDYSKLRKLESSNKIDGFRWSSRIHAVYVADDGYRYRYAFVFQTQNGSLLPGIYVYTLNGTSEKEIIAFTPDNNVDIEVNDYDELSDSQVDELTKRGMKIYNQFIKDYENI